MEDLLGRPGSPGSPGGPGNPTPGSPCSIGIFMHLFVHSVINIITDLYIGSLH